LYVVGGAALGLAAVGAAKKRQKRPRAAAGSADFEPRQRLAGDVSDVPIPVQEALAASARVHGLQHSISEELARDIFDHAEERRPTPGRERHQVSNLVGPGAIAPDEIAIGEELVDPGALEAPLGQSADPQIDRELLHDKLLQPDSTGAALLREDLRGGLHEQWAPLEGPPLDEGELTAQPSKATLLPDDAYDAVAPDDLGSEWLTRATETSTMPAEDELLPTDIAVILEEAGMSVVSQGTLDAASAEQLEADSAEQLEADASAGPEDTRERSGSERKVPRGKQG
jgi:hypothetical protein